MKIEKKDLTKSQVELAVVLSVEEFAPYIKQGAENISREVKIEGFRPGKAPYEILKQKIGEMTILEEAARIAVNKTIAKAIKEYVHGQPVGQPKVDVTKLAPDNPLEYKVVLAMLPKIELGDYKNAKVKQKKAEVSDQEADKMLDDLREMRVKETIVDREVRDRDKVLVDIQMFLDKVPVEGGQSQDAAVVIGQDYIIPGFDRKLLGAKKRDVREFGLPYPKDYHMRNLAGKMVEFKVTIKEVYQRELPGLDEGFATGLGLKNIQELKENIKKNLKAQKERENEQKAEREMLEKILAKSRFGDIPEMLVNHEVKTMLAELEQGITSQGGKFDEYLQGLNKTRDQLTLDLLPEAVKRVKISLLIREVAVLENIQVKEAEVDSHIQEMKKYYQKAAKNSAEAKDMAEKMDAPEHKDYVFNILTSRKVIDQLKEWNVGA